MAEHRVPKVGEGSGSPRWPLELLGALTAVAIGIATVAALASSPRSKLLFRDGDSLVTTLIVRSLAQGQAQDWALSTVLFLPETALLAVLSLLGLGITGTLALAGVVNIVGLYGALRVAAGSPDRSRAPVVGALLALGAFALLAVTEHSPSRDALELASLLATTTYYAATVVGVVLAVGLARRGLDQAGGAQWGPVVGIALVATASVVTNPLFAVWTVPLALVLGVVAVWRRAALRLLAGLMTGSLLGFVGRMPLAPLIANTGAGYFEPSQWRASLGYYGALLAERWSAPWGAASVIAVVVLWGGSVAATVMLARRREFGATVVAACGWAMPLLVVVGAVAAGTHAARYLQPAVFATLLGLVVLPMLLPVMSARRVTRPAIAVGATAVALALAMGIGLPRLSAAANARHADLECVVEWIEQSGRTGAGQFWTVRLPKAHLKDPRALVQVDHRLRGYAWLVNRDDFTPGEVSFLVLDAQSSPFDLPGEATIDDAQLVLCGRYTIADFGTETLPIGPLRS